jgi:glucose/mannose-6-phosphate isomerase
LLEFAKKNKIPYIQLPETAIQPRSAIGFSIIALAKLIEGDDAVTELKTLAKKLDVTKWEKTGKDFAQGIRGQIPVIYSSRTNFSIAYNWKIKFNETAKIPAFYNVFPELNHNEMAGFDPIESTKGLSDKFHFIFLDDPSDHPKIMHRAQVTKKLYTDRGLLVTTFQLAGDTVFEKIFNSLILADWIALSVSKMYGTVPDAVPIVEELKKLMI